MKAKRLPAVTALLMAAVARAAEPPDMVTQEATGEAAIVDDDEARAAKGAQDQALRAAVERVAGVTANTVEVMVAK